jgi:hypothetical protein
MKRTIGICLTISIGLTLAACSSATSPSASPTVSPTSSAPPTTPSTPTWYKESWVAANTVAGHGVKCAGVATNSPAYTCFYDSTGLVSLRFPAIPAGHTLEVTLTSEFETTLNSVVHVQKFHYTQGISGFHLLPGAAPTNWHAEVAQGNPSSKTTTRLATFSAWE